MSNRGQHRAYVVLRGDGTLYGWSLWCPGCSSPHVFTDGWSFNGDQNSPTFSPSMLATNTNLHGDGPARCHSFVREGQWQYLNDCTHELAGQTVDVPREWPWQEYGDDEAPGAE